MKKVKPLNPQEKLKQLAKKAVEVHALADSLHREIRAISLEDDDIVKYTIEASDSTGYIMTILERLTDGSPRPFRHECYDRETGKITNDNFAQVGPRCKDHPNESAAYLNGIDFSLEELTDLRDWINATLKWNSNF